MRHAEQRVLVLFDVQNMYYSTKHLYNTKVNFKTILDEAVAGRRLVRAISYVIRADIKEETNFHDALNKIGIEVKSKELQIFIGGTKKGDWDIGIAMDAVRMAGKIDTLVLVSGDGDFRDLLEYMKSHGCRTEVIALGRTSSKMLKETADLFTDLEKDPQRFFIGYKKKRPMPKGDQVQSTNGNTAHDSPEPSNVGYVAPQKMDSTPKPAPLPFITKRTPEFRMPLEKKPEVADIREGPSAEPVAKEEPSEKPKDDKKKGIASRLKRLISK